MSKIKGNDNNNNMKSSNIPPESKKNLFVKKRTAAWIWLFLFSYYWVSVKERQSLLDFRQISTIDTNNKSDLALTDNGKVKSINPYFILEPDDEFTPKIAWLMSFPNSGTSYTMTLVGRASNRSFATNYASEVTPKDAISSLSIYPRRPEGPFWPGMSGKIVSPRLLPDTYVITKTHCGSRCIECGPREYIETPKEFLRNCASGHLRTSQGRQRHRRPVRYPPERVSKAIHLIRNPMNNIIARFHLDHHHKMEENDVKWLSKHPNDPVGFHAWCRDQQVAYTKQDAEFFGSVDKIPKAPCYGEFYKYTQWHNLAHESLQLIDHQVPVLTVYYEDYTERFNQTATSILDFLELELKGDLHTFSARTNYGHYFNSTQQEDIKSLIFNVASNSTWEKIRRYFEA